MLGMGLGNHPKDEKPCWGNILQQWGPFWTNTLRPSTGGNDLKDLKEPHPTSFPVLSLFSLIPPPKGDPNANTQSYTLLRRGARKLDMSAAVSAGELVVLAESDGNQPLPFPLEINGNKVAGEGTVFYQFALPLDHNGAFAPPK